MNEAFSAEALMDRYLAFPDITYEQFMTLPTQIRKEIVKKNRVLATDTYNRSMCHIKGPDWNKHESYVLQFRRTAGNGYLIACGIRSHLDNVLRMPILETELKFAQEFYRDHAKVPLFNNDMWNQVVYDNHGRLPIEIDAVPDGTVLAEGDPVMRVRGPGELAAHIEPDMHRPFFETLGATTAHEIERTVGSERFIEVAKRSTPNEGVALQGAEAMYIGGGIYRTSNDAAAACFEQLEDSGTIGHRYIQCKVSEVEAFRSAIEAADHVVLLVDLTDSKRGIEGVIKLKREYRDSHPQKKIWIRLDSGNLQELGLYTLERFRDEGFEDPVRDVVVIEDLESVQEMGDLDDAFRAKEFDEKRFIGYGGGGLLMAKNKHRNDASSAYKLSLVGRDPKIKFGDPKSRGKESLPGEPTITIMQAGERVVGQIGEYDSSQGHDLLVLAYRDGKILLPDDIQQARELVGTSFAQLLEQVELGERTPLSPETTRLRQQVADHYGVSLT